MILPYLYNQGRKAAEAVDGLFCLFARRLAAERSGRNRHSANRFVALRIPVGPEGGLCRLFHRREKGLPGQPAARQRHGLVPIGRRRCRRCIAKRHVKETREVIPPAGQHLNRKDMVLARPGVICCSICQVRPASSPEPLALPLQRRLEFLHSFLRSCLILRPGQNELGPAVAAEDVAAANGLKLQQRRAATPFLGRGRDGEAGQGDRTDRNQHICNGFVRHMNPPPKGA